MKTSIQHLVKRDNGSDYEDVNVVIDWEGLSHDDILTIASLFIHNKVKAALQRQDLSLPMQVTYYAIDFVHLDAVPTPKEWKIPERWKSGTDRPRETRKSKIDLSNLSKKDMEILMTKLQEIVK